MGPQNLEHRRDETGYSFKETIPTDGAKFYVSTIGVKKGCKVD